MIFWTNVDFSLRSVRGDRNKSSNQKTLFRFAVSLVFVSNSAVFEPRCLSRRGGHHAEVGIIHARPLDCTIDRVTISGFSDRGFQTNSFKSPTNYSVVATIGV